MQLALLLLALLCFGERGWGSYHGATFDPGGGSSLGASSSKSSDDENSKSFTQYSVPELQKYLSEKEKTITDDEIKEIDKANREKFEHLNEIENPEEIEEFMTWLTDWNAWVEAREKKNDSKIKPSEAVKDSQRDVQPIAGTIAEPLKNQTPSVYRTPLPPSSDSYFKMPYIDTNQSFLRGPTGQPVPHWTSGLPSSSSSSSSPSESSSGSGSRSSSSSSGNSSSEGSHSSGSSSSSSPSSFDSGSGELPSSSSLSTGTSSPTDTSSNSRGISSTPSGTGISQPPISGLTPKPTPIAGGSMAPPTATGGHGGSSLSSSGGSSVPSASGSSSPVQFNGSNTQTPLMSRPADAPAPSKIQTENPKALAEDANRKSTEALGKALPATKSPNNLISLSELKNPAGASQPDTGAKPLDNLASAGTVERYQKNTPESTTRSYASNDRFITPEKAASSNSAKEISKPNSETSSSEIFSGSNTSTSVGEQKPSPKANKTPVALGAGASGILSLSEEVAQPSPISVAEIETSKNSMKETKEAPVIAKDISSEQAPKEGTFSGDLAIKPKTTKEVSPIGKGLSEFAKEVEEAELKNQAVEITAAPLNAGLTSPPKITPRGLASGIPQAPAKQSPAGTFAKVGAQLDAFASRIRAFFK
jgi:hypothetical protein